MSNSNEKLLNPDKVDFFHDFILFLKHLQKQPIKRTLTGKISLSDIKPLISQFRQQETIKEFQKYGWKMRREEELEFLEQIKIIAEMMFIIYKRRGYFGLSRNGKAFLTKLKPLEQYKEMVLHFWYRVNWGYFSLGSEVKGLNLAEKLQQHQNLIWKTLFAKGKEWIDYTVFCQSLTDYLHLNEYFIDPYSNDIKYEMISDMRYALFRKNLIRLGCVETEERQGKYKWSKEIVRLKSTDLGLFAYHKALFENYL